MADDNTTLNNNCQQRTIYLTHQQPNVRYEPVSPYPAYTKFELDMRRKAEILKYNKHDGNIANLSKSERWAKLNTNQRSFSKRTVVNCPDVIIYTPTTSSGVPGPVIDLFLDRTIPLYNYLSDDNRTYEENFKLNDANFNIIVKNDIFFNEDLSSEFIYLIFTNPTNPSYTFSFNSPLSILIKGSKLTVPPRKSVSVRTLNVAISKIEFSVFYGDFNIIPLSTPIITIPISDISLSLALTTGNFYASKYVGNFLIKNITLSAQPEISYIFYLKFTYDFSTYDISGNLIPGLTDLSGVSFASVCNLTDTNDKYYLETTNCNILNPPDFSLFPPFSIQGT
jgi:hypothetical protein